MEKCPLCVLRLRSGRLEAQLIEEHVRKLLGGIQVEGLADRLEDLLLDLAHAGAELLRELLEEGQVEQDAGHFHLGQAGDQRHLDLVHQLLAVDGLELGLQDGHEAQGGLGIRGGIDRGGVDGDLGHAELVLAGANELLDVRHLFAQARQRTGS